MCLVVLAQHLVVELLMKGVVVVVVEMVVRILGLLAPSLVGHNVAFYLVVAVVEHNN